MTRRAGCLEVVRIYGVVRVYGVEGWGSNGVFTLAVSGTGTSAGTGKNGLYDIMHYTGTGTGEITGKNTNGCYTHFSGPENLPSDEL